MIRTWIAAAVVVVVGVSSGCEEGDASCSPGKSCESGSYCAFTKDTCGDRGFEGVCHREPQSCGNGDTPVCGCDGNTYANDCRARQAGTDVRSPGPCGAGSGGTAGDGGSAAGAGGAGTGGASGGDASPAAGAAGAPADAAGG